MIHANTDTAVARSLHSMIPVAGITASTARLLREDREHYLPDSGGDEEGAAGPALSASAPAHTRHARDAQALLDDAVNLVGLLLDAVEHDCDTRAAQSRTVLGMAVECLHGAHRAIEEQESRDHELFLAHAELKERLEEENRAPMDDFTEDEVDDGSAGETISQEDHHALVV